MSCRDYQETIAALMDGAIDPARQRELERHLEGCPSCRALVADLKSIQAAAFTLDRLDVPAHILPGLRSRLAAEPSPAASGRLLAFPQSRAAITAWLLAAAALLVITTAGVMSVLRPVVPHSDVAASGTEPADTADAVASVQAELQAAMEHSERAIQKLEEIAKRDDALLDPQVAAVFKKSLLAIDQAIDESRSALQPESLFDALQSKVALLQQSVELINEMRKGNQAEAGRLLQGLNQ